MRGELALVGTDAADPIGYEPPILPRGQGPLLFTHIAAHAQDRLWHAPEDLGGATIPSGIEVN